VCLVQDNVKKLDNYYNNLFKYMQLYNTFKYPWSRWIVRISNEKNR
jgi:hypothetical protein